MHGSGEDIVISEISTMLGHMEMGRFFGKVVQASKLAGWLGTN
jgi:hypothetical protein